RPEQLTASATRRCEGSGEEVRFGWTQQRDASAPGRPRGQLAKPRAARSNGVRPGFLREVTGSRVAGLPGLELTNGVANCLRFLGRAPPVEELRDVSAVVERTGTREPLEP